MLITQTYNRFFIGFFSVSGLHVDNTAYSTDYTLNHIPLDKISGNDDLSSFKHTEKDTQRVFANVSKACKYSRAIN